MKLLAAAVAVPLALSPQALVDDATNWLRGMGIPSPERTITVADHQPPGHAEAGYTPAAFIYFNENETLHVTPWLLSRWEDLGRGERRPWAVKALVHEQLHLGQSHGPLEEGIVDAVAWDLAPAYGRRIGVRTRLHRDDVVPTDVVHHVRWLSAQVCDEGWPSRCGRLWRRALLVSDDAHRAQMIEAAANG